MSNNKVNYTFWNLICKYTIQIPIIQRDYAQGREVDKVTEIRNTFLDSIYESLSLGKHLDLDFIYGSLKEDELFIPLDGQQRLTTLFLLHWYLAIKEKKQKDIEGMLDKFTYETRTSSREFCNSLVKNSNNFEEVNFNTLDSVSSMLGDCSWFFLSWKKDPTIRSMLVMLDAIHNKFKNSCDLFDILIDKEKSPITFQFIELENFGLEDSLYIKMNARGKALTVFENFKANFQQVLQQKEDKGELSLGFTRIFVDKIDTDWTDIFWNYRNKTTNLFDDEMMNFLNVMIINNYAQKDNSELLSYEHEKRLIYFISSAKHISFAKYIEWNSFDEKVITDISSTLDSLKNSNDKIKTYLSDTTLIDEEVLFKKVLGSTLDYADRIMFYAICQYFKENLGNIGNDKFFEWIRVIKNLSINTIYNQVGDFIRAIESITKLIKNCNDILTFLSNEDNKISGFLGDQIEEERIKAILILKDQRWRNAILEAEKHLYFKGQICFILKFAGITEAYISDKKLNWDNSTDDDYFNKFINYFEKSRAIFGDIGLKVNRDLWRRALLCKGDYLLSSSRNLSFLIDGFHRDISWKRLLRENTIKREYVKELLDEIDVKDINSSLIKVINNSNVNDWRKYFITYPNLIVNGCGTNKLIRKNGSYDILLLNTSTTSGYCKEYYTYALYLELRKDNGMIRYVETRGADNDKYISISKSNIAIDIMYELTSDGWKYGVAENGNKRFYKNREEVIMYLKSKQYIK